MVNHCNIPEKSEIIIPMVINGIPTAIKIMRLKKCQGMMDWRVSSGYFERTAWNHCPLKAIERLLQRIGEEIHGRS